MLFHSCINVRKHVFHDWTVAGLQSFVSRFVSYWFKRPNFLQIIYSVAYFKMKGAGLSIADSKMLFHVIQINFKLKNIIASLFKKKRLFYYTVLHKQDH